MSCVFCEIVLGRVAADVVYEDERTMAFLDTRPLFPGHTLVVPRVHVETLGELDAALIEPFFGASQRLALAVQRAMGAEGTFVAINNHVSQSVPHLHLHVVPRRKGDGLKGFFWPRTKYASPEEATRVGGAIREALL